MVEEGRSKTEGGRRRRWKTEGRRRKMEDGRWKKEGRKDTSMHIRARATTHAVITVVMAVALSGCSYNTFTSQEEGVKAAWSEVQNQLQRRNDLIPNLVETVKGYAKQERDIFIAVAESRSRLLAAKTPEEQVEAANQQTS